MSVTDTVTGSNYLNRSTRETIYLPTLGQGTPTVTSMGDAPVLLGTLNVIADSNGIRADIISAAGVGATGAMYGDRQYMRALDIQAYINFRFNHIIGDRIFIGFSDQSAHNMVSSDSPTGSYFGLWFSYTFDSTSFYQISSDGTTIVRKKLFAVDQNYHELFLRLYRDSGNAECQIQIDDNTFNGVIGHIPPNTDLLAFITANFSIDGAAKHTEVGKVSIKSSR